ncbi:hypothetical protein AB1Y20_013500 [Prymnesium parvum]|uniref:Disintegrin domain-containing protein n=1 Tax=Prymnesium parvum TaxID=97485 RepID=A0AB34II10_PRYPA
MRLRRTTSHAVALTAGLLGSLATALAEISPLQKALVIGWKPPKLSPPPSPPPPPAQALTAAAAAPPPPPGCSPWCTSTTCDSVGCTSAPPPPLSPPPVTRSGVKLAVGASYGGDDDLPSECAAVGSDCTGLRSRCCADDQMSCFVRRRRSIGRDGAETARLAASCEPACFDSAGEPCETLHACAADHADCTLSGCCENEEARCFRQGKRRARCLLECGRPAEPCVPHDPFADAEGGELALLLGAVVRGGEQSVDAVIETLASRGESWGLSSASQLLLLGHVMAVALILTLCALICLTRRCASDLFSRCVLGHDARTAKLLEPSHRGRLPFKPRGGSAASGKYATVAATRGEEEGGGAAHAAVRLPAAWEGWGEEGGEEEQESVDELGSEESASEEGGEEAEGEGEGAAAAFVPRLQPWHPPPSAGWGREVQGAQQKAPPTSGVASHARYYGASHGRVGAAARCDREARQRGGRTCCGGGGMQRARSDEDDEEVRPVRPEELALARDACNVEKL